MGRPDPDTDCPRLITVPLLGPRYELAWGCDPGTGDGWHSATEGPAEHVTAATWASLTAAAALGQSQLDAALMGSSAARAWVAAKTRATAAGQLPALLACCTARYSGWQTASLSALWVTV
jgi:hypothetical protein